jgi:hypothetical protein
MTVRPTVLTAAADLAAGATAQRFDGAVHGGGVPISFLLNHTPPGAVHGFRTPAPGRSR